MIEEEVERVNEDRPAHGPQKQEKTSSPCSQLCGTHGLCESHLALPKTMMPGSVPVRPSMKIGFWP